MGTNLTLHSQCSATESGGGRLETAADLNTNSYSWTVRAPAGSSVVLSVQDSKGETSSTPGIRVADIGGKTC
ncbi:hypothetical protein PM082_003491 [Marasmius tenuissimus]|nr:hypothetical protein PM082_003491 [Marasmius tenuissimus]